MGMPSDEPTWDAEADLVVLGSGGSGLSAAAVAAIEGLRVMVLEKADVLGGTTSRSSGGVWVPNNDHMAEVGVSDSPEEALEYVRACAGNNGDDETLVAFVEKAPEMARYFEMHTEIRWKPWPPIGGAVDYRDEAGAKPGGRCLNANSIRVDSLGDLAPYLRIGMGADPDVDVIDYYAQRKHLLPPSDETALPTDSDGQVVRGMGELSREAGDRLDYVAAGTGLVAHLLKAAQDHGATFHPGTAAKRLVVQGGRVVGVMAERGGKSFAVRATAGVVIATGGYSRNEELKRLWLLRPLDFTGEVDENEGDGHLMGMAVGAQVANLGDAWWMPHIYEGRPNQAGYNIALTREDRILPHTLIVNGAGRRFVNEATNYYDIGAAFGEKVGVVNRNLPAWLIFDQQGVEKYAALNDKLAVNGAQDSIFSADSLTELGELLGVDPVALHRTVKTFNEFARSGVDLDFARGQNAWDRAWGDPNNMPNPSLGTLEKPPFHAVSVLSGALATKGGLRINAAGEVLSADPGAGPIAGLYAVGNCSSTGVSGGYPGPGATLGPILTFGYIVGMGVAAHVAGRRQSVTSR